MLKIEDRYMLKLYTSETMKLFDNKEKLTGKAKNGEHIPSTELVEVVLLQCNLIDNQYQ